MTLPSKPDDRYTVTGSYLGQGWVPFNCSSNFLYVSIESRKKNMIGVVYKNYSLHKTPILV